MPHRRPRRVAHGSRVPGDHDSYSIKGDLGHDSRLDTWRSPHIQDVVGLHSHRHVCLAAWFGSRISIGRDRLWCGRRAGLRRRCHCMRRRWLERPCGSYSVGGRYECPGWGCQYGQVSLHCLCGSRDARRRDRANRQPAAQPTARPGSRVFSSPHSHTDQIRTTVYDHVRKKQGTGDAVRRFQLDRSGRSGYNG